MSLAGKRVVNTRAAHQAAELDDLLRGRGAQPVAYPCIDISPPADPAPLDAALRDAAAGRFDWLALTSTNAVLAVARRLEALGYQRDVLVDVRVAAVGPATASAIHDLLGLVVDAIPDDYQAEALADALQAEPGARIFLPQSAIARPTLAEKLVAAGMDVTAVPAYQTVIGSGGADLPAMLAAGHVDGITFTSPSTVTNLIRRIGNEGGGAAHLENVCIACIGPSTAEAARANRLPVSVTPVEHTLEGLVAGLETYFSEAIEA